ncbi:unnamed protein product [Rotaria sp. Silwood2]|nr:unnamed protein product [Rotaria sp. Silwood2]
MIIHLEPQGLLFADIKFINPLIKPAPKLKQQKILFFENEKYRLIRKGVITSNNSDENDFISSSRDSHYVVYDMLLEDGMPPRKVGYFPPKNQSNYEIKLKFPKGVNINLFCLASVLGQGHFGKVILQEYTPRCGDYYAVLKKGDILVLSLSKERVGYGEITSTFDGKPEFLVPKILTEPPYI